VHIFNTSLFIAKTREKILEFNQLNNFERIWTHKISWFEEPNRGRGGWSGVGRLRLAMPDGGELGAFLKRQENHQRRTFRHPINGEPTFACEFNMMRYLQAHDVVVPEPIFFAQKNEGGSPQAILITEELVGYRSLETITEELFTHGRPSLTRQRSIVRGVAATVRKLHSAHIQHRSLYPKHLFVKFLPNADPQVAVIDLEKSRVKLLSPMCTIFDLATLNRHAKYWSRTSRLYFLKQYLGIERLSPWDKFLCRLICRRTNRPKGVPL
jgi:Lipopolysaccharide kinase (Kdo/WaaP) family